jgi:hypothetical protein
MTFSLKTFHADRCRKTGGVINVQRRFRMSLGGFLRREVL